MERYGEPAMNGRVLVVDDDAAIRRLVVKALSGLGYIVTEIADGSQVMSVVREQRPCLVLLDLHMPRLDGLAVLTELREFDSKLPVIILTGDADPERARLLIERGACDFITKPFDVERLRDTVFFNSLQ